MLLICGCAIGSVGWFQGYEVWRRYAQESNGRERFVAKYAPLRRWLPADEVACFLVAEPQIVRAVPPVVERPSLAQYAVAPRRLAENVASRWVVVDSDSPEAVPRAAVSGRWKLVVDLHNGVRLYRTDLKE
jgi:hypothetical protein